MQLSSRGKVQAATVPSKRLCQSISVDYQVSTQPMLRQLRIGRDFALALAPRSTRVAGHIFGLLHHTELSWASTVLRTLE